MGSSNAKAPKGQGAYEKELGIHTLQTEAAFVMSPSGRPQSALRLVCALSEVALTKRISPAAAVALDVLLNPPGQRVPAASLLPALSGAAHRLCRPPQRLTSLQNGRRSRRHIRRQMLRSQLLARRHPCLPVALPSDCRRFKMVEGHDCPRRHIRRLEAMLPAEGDAVPSRLAQ